MFKNSSKQETLRQGSLISPKQSHRERHGMLRQKQFGTNDNPMSKLLTKLCCKNYVFKLNFISGLDCWKTYKRQKKSQLWVPYRTHVLTVTQTYVFFFRERKFFSGINSEKYFNYTVKVILETRFFLTKDHQQAWKNIYLQLYLVTTLISNCQWKKIGGTMRANDDRTMKWNNIILRFDLWQPQYYP